MCNHGLLADLTWKKRQFGKIWTYGTSRTLKFTERRIQSPFSCQQLVSARWPMHQRCTDYREFQDTRNSGPEWEATASMVCRFRSVAAFCNVKPSLQTALEGIVDSVKISKYSMAHRIFRYWPIDYGSRRPITVFPKDHPGVRILLCQPNCQFVWQLFRYYVASSSTRFFAWKVLPTSERRNLFCRIWAYAKERDLVQVTWSNFNWKSLEMWFRLVKTFRKRKLRDAACVRLASRWCTWRATPKPCGLLNQDW